MKLSFACFAKFVDINSDGTFTILGGGFDVIAVEQLPGSVPVLSLFILLEVRPEECGVAHTLKLSAVNPAGAAFEPFSSELPFTPEPPGGEAQDMKVKLILFASGLHFPQEGLYVVRIQGDGTELGELGVQVRQKPTPEGKN